MSAPSSLDEYNRRFAANAKVSGYGMDVAQHFPCPFCAAPEWLVIKIMDLAMDSSAMSSARTCKECGRSGRMLLNPTAGGGSSMELVQTGGDDPPPWMPAIRRVTP